MVKLSNEEMFKVEGGAIKGGVLGGIIAGIVSFIAGVIHGYLNPRKCN